MQVRRVVTGHNDGGEAVFVDDAYVETTTVTLSTTVYHELWRADEAPTFPNSGVEGPKTTFFPSPGGYRFFILTIPRGTATRTSRALTSRRGFESCKKSCPACWRPMSTTIPGCTPLTRWTWRSSCRARLYSSSTMLPNGLCGLATSTFRTARGIAGTTAAQRLP